MSSTLSLHTLSSLKNSIHIQESGARAVLPGKLGLGFSVWGLPDKRAGPGAKETYRERDLERERRPDNRAGKRARVYLTKELARERVAEPVRKVKR